MYDYIIVDKKDAYVRQEGREWPEDEFFQSQELLRLATSKAWEGHAVVAIKDNGDSYTLEKRNFAFDRDWETSSSGHSRPSWRT